MQVEPAPFVYRPPPANDAVKQVVRLARIEIMRGAVQVTRSGGEESLHLHEGQDGFWMVLRGRARFHGADDTLLGEFGPHEGILIPRKCAYWFESTGDSDLELLQVLAFDRRGPVARRNLEPHQLDDRRAEKLDGRVASEIPSLER
jgi:mannose-6-phosphate isomerase-like protein (cupin superfamily)